MASSKTSYTNDKVQVLVRIRHHTLGRPRSQTALPAVRGQVRSPNPRSAVCGRPHYPRSEVRGRPRYARSPPTAVPGPRTSAPAAVRGRPHHPRSAVWGCAPANRLFANVYNTVLKSPRYPRSEVRGRLLYPRSAVGGRPRYPRSAVCGRPRHPRSAVRRRLRYLWSAVK